MKIYIGADHAGFELKEKIKVWLEEQNIEYEDCGNLKFDKDDDYPDFAIAVSHKVVQNNSKGILLCGSAEGVCITANKINGIFAADPSGIIQTRFAREHGDINILCLAGGQSLEKQPSIPFETATEMITTFLETPFSGEERHVRRLNKIRKLEK